MPRYLIDREIPGAAKMSKQELYAISQKSCDVLREMGPSIQWIESYVTDNGITCLYYAENEKLIREHGTKGGFPVTNIREIRTTIDPRTAEGITAGV